MNRLLIIRLSAMGDVAMTAPVIEALQRKYPDTRITILTTPFFKPFFRDLEGVDFIHIDTKVKHKSLWGMWKLFREIRRKYRINMVADLHDVIRTKFLRKFFRLYRIHVAVIDKGREEKKELTSIENKVFKPLKPTYQRYADVFRELGFDIAAPEKIEHWLFPIPTPIYELTGPKTGKWIGIAPFAQHQGKIYPIGRMNEVIRELAQEKENTLFLFGGGENERMISEQIASKHSNVRCVIGRIGLSEELDLISNLDCMVSMDSSAMHMASLVGIPAVTVWGATHPYTGFLGLGQSEANAVQIDMPCRPCSIYGNEPCVYNDFPCLNGIEPQAIVDRVHKVIGS